MRHVISQARFADYLGVGRSAVNLAIRDGRLHDSVVVTESGRRMLDFDLAIQEWDEHTDIDQALRARWPRR